MTSLARFAEVWFGDFEFARDGTVRCAVFRELRTGRVLKFTGDELRAMTRAPFNVGPGSLFVAHFASAEMGCFLRLGWPLPAYVLDLYVEFRVHTNRTLEKGKKIRANLLDAQAYFGLPVRSGSVKTAGRSLALQDGPLSNEQMKDLIEYCADDTDDCARLLAKLLPHIHRLDQALLRGRYMKTVARMEHRGIPIDGELYLRVIQHWPAIRSRFIAEVDANYGVYEGTTFKMEKFIAYVQGQGITWPCTEKGSPMLDKDTFKAMAETYPQLEPLRQLRKTLAQVGKRDFPLGPDGRLRGLLSPFGSVTGRNQPGRFIFAAPKWMRGFIRPTPGKTLVYLDWSQQEIVIAAELSGDENLRASYRSGDAYLYAAKLAGAVPPDATKASHPRERGQYKVTGLQSNYGASEYGIASKLDISVGEARHFLEMHHAIYPTYWKWNDAVVATAFSRLKLTTKYGWTFQVTQITNDRQIGNWPIQSSGSEILRLAACRLTDAGIRVCAPVHDAFLIEIESEDPDEVDTVTARAAEIMEGAATTVIGCPIGCDAKVVRACGDLAEEGNRTMFDLVMRLLKEAEDER